VPRAQDGSRQIKAARSVFGFRRRDERASHGVAADDSLRVRGQPGEVRPRRRPVVRFGRFAHRLDGGGERVVVEGEEAGFGGAVQGEMPPDADADCVGVGAGDAEVADTVEGVEFVEPAALGFEGGPVGLQVGAAFGDKFGELVGLGGGGRPDDDLEVERLLFEINGASGIACFLS